MTLHAWAIGLRGLSRENNASAAKDESQNCLRFLLFQSFAVCGIAIPSTTSLQVQQLYEAAGRDLSERLNFRVDNLDARNIRQMADLRQQIDSLRGQ